LELFYFFIFLQIILHKNNTRDRVLRQEKTASLRASDLRYETCPPVVFSLRGAFRQRAVGFRMRRCFSDFRHVNLPYFIRYVNLGNFNQRLFHSSSFIVARLLRFSSGKPHPGPRRGHGAFLLLSRLSCPACFETIRAPHVLPKNGHTLNGEQLPDTTTPTLEELHMFHREHPDMAHAHHRHAEMHRYHATAHQQQAMYHHQQAEYHRQQANAYTTQANQMRFYANQPPYNEMFTAYNNQVSPVALVYQGHVSQEAIQSLREFQNPYGNQSSPVPLSYHAAHATENQAALNRGYKF
jgi:hypothetical protein